MLEINSYYIVLLSIIILFVRLSYCNRVYDKKVLDEILYISISTSLVWMVYSVKKENKFLTIQMSIMIFCYLALLVR